MLGLASSDGVASGVGVGVGVGVADGFGVGLGVGFGVAVGRGVAIGPQFVTPEPLALPVVAEARYFAGGTFPLSGNRTPTSFRIAATSGSWIEPRAS
jgi:hypothetical protein